MTLNLDAQTLDEIINTTFAYHIRNKVFAQADQDTPALQIMRDKKKTFPGGEGLKLKLTASMEHTAQWEIYSGNDQLSFQKMSNKKLATYEAVENHMGLELTYTELKAAGFIVTDANTKGSMSFGKASDSELQRITDYLQGKMDEMDFSGQQSFSKDRIWSDGANGFLGLPALISTSPSTGTTGGLSRVTNAKWRNRALVGASDQILPSTTSLTLLNTVQEEVRRLRVNRAGKQVIYAGNKAMKGFEIEVRASGQLSQDGFNKKGGVDVGIDGIKLAGMPKIIHEPALDDLNLQDFFYIHDTDGICLVMLDGDDMEAHLPARPYDRMAGYKSLTWTGMVMANKLNSSGVYQVNDASL